MLHSLSHHSALMVTLMVVGSLSCSSSVSVQPATAIPVTGTSDSVIPMILNDQLALNVNFKNVSTDAALMKLAGLGNFEFVVRGVLPAHIDSVQLQGSSPEDALKKVCEVAHLSSQKIAGVWNIEQLKAPVAPPADEPQRVQLAFANVDTRDLITLIGTQFKIGVRVDPAVKGKLMGIRLNEVTPQKALEMIADSTNLQMTKDGELWVFTPQPIPG